MKKQAAAQPAVGGIHLRFGDDGTPLFGYQRSPKAGHNFTTVGGRIEPGETVIDAMMREFQEELQPPSLSGFHFVDLGMPSTTYETTSGIRKEFHLVLILDYHRGDVTRPNKKEVAEVRWHPLVLFGDISHLFSEGKREMLLAAINTIYCRYSHLLIRELAA